MTLSRRHHYIPRFLIEKFTDTDNKVWVFDKEKGKVIDQRRSSKSIFYKEDRNNFNVDGKMVDNIELMYGEADNFLSRNLDKVLSTHSMTGRELTLLIVLVALTKWRVPASDATFYNLLKDVPIEQLGMKIAPVDSNQEESEQDKKKISEMDIVTETKRLLLSIQPLLIDKNLSEIHQNCFIVSHNEFPSLLGDVPVIEKENDNYNTLKDFIFPLSSNETLICKRGSDKSITKKLFYIQRDLTTFHLANKYVVCKSKEHLLNISEVYSTLMKENKTHLLTKYIFDLIN